MLAQGQIITANFDLNGVAQWCKANQLDASANQEAHFHEPGAALRGQFNLGDGGGSAKGYGSQGLKRGGSHRGKSSNGRGSNFFDKNRISKGAADAQASVAHLANVAGLAGNEFDLLLFAKAQFPETVSDFGRGGKAFNANHRAGFDAAQRADFGSSTLAFKHNERLSGFLLLHRRPN